MGSIVPRAEIPSEPKEPSGLGAFRWIIVGLILVATGAATLHWIHSVRRERAAAVEAARSQKPSPQQGNALISFTDDDVEVSHRWTFLSGKHPTVTFTCRLSPALPPTELVVLCYRSLGAAEWNSAEVSSRRDKTCRITLRDLHRDMPYECFFIAYTKDKAIRSNTVMFSTERSPEP